jgi:hypothetical protein
MLRRYFLRVFYGFVLAAVLALGPPIAFLMMPAAGLFLGLLPIWSIGVVCLLFLVLLVFGAIPYAVGVAMFAVAVALSPVGSAAIALIDENDRYAKQNDFIQRKFKECATTGYVPLKKPSAKYDLIVVDHIDTREGEENYDIADTVAVLTGMRVVEIRRAGPDSHFSEAWETMAEHSNACVGERDSAKVGPTPRGWQRKMAPLGVDVCLRRTKIPDPSGDRTPAIVLRAIPFGLGDCHATAVVERTESGDVELGRVHYDSFHQRYYPDLALPEGVPLNNWLLVLLSEVLQRDLSDKALMAYAANTKK